MDLLYVKSYANGLRKYTKEFIMKKNKNIPLNLKEQINSRIGLICSIVVMILLVFVFHQLDYQIIQKPADQAAKEAEQKKLEAEKAAKAPEISTATVIAVGDNLYHDSLIQSGESDSGTWNYDAIYENVKDEIQAADIAMVDQETVLTTEHDAVSGYPSFATPTEVGDALINTGFDVIESATNHIDDYGYDYMAQTLNFWKTSYPDVPVLGIHDSEEDANTVKTLEVNGIKVAFLDYTYGTNNSGAGDGKDYMIDIFEKDKVASMIEKAKADSDVLIFVAHWGKEMETMPTEYEKEWATFLMQHGVDVVIGGHPHILQPYGRMSDKEGHSMLIFYSLGNFVSTQESFDALLEGMGCFTIQKTVQDGKTSIEIKDAEVKPMVMHYNKDAGVFSPYMLSDYTEELAAQHELRTVLGDDSFTLANLQARFKEIMSLNVKPSTNTDLLNVKFDWEGNMIDKTTGNVVEDTESIHSWEYLSSSADNSDSSDSNDGYNDTSGDSSDNGSDTSYDDSSYDNSYDDGSYDDSYDSSYYDDSSYDDSYDNSYYDDGSYDDSYNN